MCKKVIASCTCADVLDFELIGVKIFLLNIRSEYQNLVENSEMHIIFNLVGPS